MFLYSPAKGYFVLTRGCYIISHSCLLPGTTFTRTDTSCRCWKIRPGAACRQNPDIRISAARHALLCMHVHTYTGTVCGFAGLMWMYAPAFVSHFSNSIATHFALCPLTHCCLLFRHLPVRECTQMTHTHTHTYTHTHTHTPLTCVHSDDIRQTFYGTV